MSAPSPGSEACLKPLVRRYGPELREAWSLCVSAPSLCTADDVRACSVRSGISAALCQKSLKELCPRGASKGSLCVSRTPDCRGDS